MARSRKRTPISGVTCSESNKKFKQQEHRRERRAVRQGLLKCLEDEYLPHPKHYGNEWSSPRDGKMWFGDLNTYTYRSFLGFNIEIDKEYYSRLLRK